MGSRIVLRSAHVGLGVVMMLVGIAGSADAHHVDYTSITVTGATVDTATGVVTFTGVIRCTAPVWASPWGFTGQQFGNSGRGSSAFVTSRPGVLCPGPEGATFTAVSSSYNPITEKDDAWFYPGPIRVALHADNCPYFDHDRTTSACLYVSVSAELHLVPSQARR
jgi:hypothetical protein